MVTLEFIRKKNKNKQSFFNTKVAKSTLLKKNMKKEETYF
ncbi:putative ABC transporter, ATP-binding protein [Clostridium botulinum CFSAN001628]|nr:putative ABC transporter, ATP-binding protein [Clostridium botulinum CFSAN001628]